MKAIFLLLMIALSAYGRVLAGESARAVATLTSGRVSGITMISTGSGYSTEPRVALTGGGGTGATAKAVLSGDVITGVILLAAGNDYSSPPTVSIEAPPEEFSVRTEVIPRLTVSASRIGGATVEWAPELSGPWTAMTHLMTDPSGVVVVDLEAGSSRRFYRAVPSVGPRRPPGFVWIPPGTFVMGSPADEPEREFDEAQHTVTLTKGFWMCDHEVTEGEVETLAPGVRWILDPKLPVGLATWVQAVDYCEKLTEQERTAGRITADQVYRLPTEAEWEYAARAGTTGLRYGALDEIAWFAPTNATGPTPPQPGKQKAPNAWGLYDMIGGVFEWCSDRYELYPAGPVVDPQGPDGGTRDRVLRGGRRAADRYYARQSDWFIFGSTGFRVALTAGRGDTNPPSGAGGEIGAEPRIQVAPMRKLVVDGPLRSSILVEYADEASGPWTVWTHVVGAAGGVPLVDPAPASLTRLYRAVRDPLPPARPGFQWIPPGTFVMGSPTTEVGRQANEVQHTVTLTRGFWMRSRELVESDYQAVLGLDRKFTLGASWDEAVEYCHRLTEQERAVGRISFQEAYRLPTEAEWEYAARAGTTGPRYSDQFESVPNAWGLWDVLGGYEEWCSDWLGDYPAGPVTDPQGPVTGTWRVLRGGMFANPPEAFRSASRSGFFPMNGFGLYKTFRPVLGSVW